MTSILVDRMNLRADLTEFHGLPVLDVRDEIAHAAEAIGTGALSPIVGFQHADEIDSVNRELSLPSGDLWSIPIVFAPAEDGLPRIPTGQDVLLAQSGNPIALFALEDVFPFDVDAFARGVLGSTDPSHPGVTYLRRTYGPRAYAGKVTVIRRPEWGALESFRLDPRDTRQTFAERRWRTVVAFQTTNPPHRGYEYIHRTVLELYDGLFIHPVVDTVRPKYAPEAILRGYRALIDNYYRPERIVLAALKTKMFFAGPREALQHAIIRRNFGCTHIIIGRRHADTLGLYGDYDAWGIFDRVDRDRLGIEPLFFREVFFCPRCGTHTTETVCPHRQDRLSISGTQVRASLKAGLPPPEHAMRPEVAEAIRDAVIA